MIVPLTKEEVNILVDAMSYYLDHNEEIEFNDEGTNALLEKLSEIKADNP